MKKEMFISYLQANVMPILVDFISSEDIEGSVVIPSDIDIKELNGHYKETNFVLPKWLNEILSSNNNRILVIDQLDKISKEEQLKFYELLKYRKISTFELPKNCVIILTANEINKDTINEKILSLVAQI